MSSNTELEQKKNEVSISERFMNQITALFTSDNGAPNVTEFQKRLIQGYFVRIDTMLKDLEIKRLGTQESQRSALSYTWSNIDLPKLAPQVFAFSSIGLDATQKNQVHPVARPNASKTKYEVALEIGYEGLEIKAKKYGLDVPDDVVVELVYANDKFKIIKKDKNNEYNSYIFETSENPFNRGEVVGGFYFHQYINNPEKNKVREFSKAAIDKRKPKYAATQFWGGWYDEMAYKTVRRAAWGVIPIDSKKIDDEYMRFLQAEQEAKEISEIPEPNAADQVRDEIASEANTENISFEIVPEGPGEPVTATAAAEPVQSAITFGPPAEPGKQQTAPF